MVRRGTPAMQRIFSQLAASLGVHNMRTRDDEEEEESIYTLHGPLSDEEEEQMEKFYGIKTVVLCFFPRPWSSFARVTSAREEVVPLDVLNLIERLNSVAH